jgi:hypothetical protein
MKGIKNFSSRFNFSMYLLNAYFAKITFQGGFFFFFQIQGKEKTRTISHNLIICKFLLVINLWKKEWIIIEDNTISVIICSSS